MAIFGSTKEDLPDEPDINDERINLGDKAKDTVSGFEGIVSSKHIYLNGCVRFALEGADKDGAPTGHVFDEQQIEVLEKGAWKSPESQAQQPHEQPKPLARTGGPRDSSIPGTTRTM